MKKGLFLFLSLSAWLYMPSAHALPFVEVVDPGIVDEDWIARVEALDPADPSSLEDGDALHFALFLARGMSEQSFTLQHLSAQGSAPVVDVEGLSLGVQLKTFPLTPPPENNVGKEENTSFLPFLPSLEVDYRGGSEPRSWSIGFNLVPPVRVAGATAVVAGLSGAWGRSIREDFRVGAEADFSVGRALAPVTATKEQYEAGELQANTDPERWENVCAPQPYGCTDSLFLTHLNLRGVAAYAFGRVLRPYVKLGALFFDETFHVQIDLSSWRLRGWLPSFALGTGLNLHPRLNTALEFSAAYRPWTISEMGAGLLWRVGVGTGYVF